MGKLLHEIKRKIVFVLFPFPSIYFILMRHHYGTKE